MNSSLIKDNEHQASSTDLITRPETGVVLTVASGPRAGEMIGTDENEFFIGYHPDCFVRFSRAQYPHANARVLFRRSREGWCISPVSGDATFVNQRQLDGKYILRSGDIVRLSLFGPDIQFTLQSGGLAVKSLVQRFLSPSNVDVDQPCASSSGTNITAAGSAACVPTVIATPIHSTVAPESRILESPLENELRPAVSTFANGVLARHRRLWIFAVAGLVSVVVGIVFWLIMFADAATK